jgi:pyruvate/2-oxoglutarate/acetoin dehydrogenase E1 component
MARRISYKDAINEALDLEMARDESVLVIGLDNAGGRGTEGKLDAWGGVLGVTKGLYGKYGERVMDTPISEGAYVGSAVGAAACGMRPVVEMMFADFLGVCFDQFMNQAAKFRYMFGGKAVTPVVMRTCYGGGFRAAAQHSQVLYNVFAHIPGLKVVVPATPYDAKGLLIQCIRDDDPVIFLEHKALYAMKGEVPEESYTIPFGQANVVQEGKDVTIVALGWMVHKAIAAAKSLAKKGVSAEIIDPRTISPIDWATIMKSVEKTGKLVIVDEAYPRCNMATDISAKICQDMFKSLKAPIKMVTPPHTPSPFAASLEDMYLPSPAKIEAAVQSIL